MTQMKVATHVLNGRRVGHFVDLVTLGSRETLKEFKVDTTQWSFVIEGSTGTFAIEVVTTGEADGEYRLGELGHLNGKDLPSTEAGEELRVHWEVEGTDKSGDIPAGEDTPDAGTYPNATLYVDLERDGGSDRLEIPINLVVNG